MRPIAMALLAFSLLFVTPPSSASPKTPAPAARPAAQHAAWTALLSAYVRPGKDGVNRFDYGALKASATDRAALDAYIKSFETMDLKGTSDANFAAWANLYNAVTVRYIVSKYPVKSIREGSLTGPWKTVKVIAGGREVSLDAIEHQILRADFKDPRLHYAINCASYSCPNLLPAAFEATTLSRDLDAAARGYINHARGVKVTDKGLVVSSIYEWFKADFGGTDDALRAHFAKYADAPLAAALKTKPKIRKHSYDWSLNDAPAPKAKTGK